MRFEEPEVFRQLEPPPGGSDRFRRRIERDATAPRLPKARFLFAGLATSALVIAVIASLEQDSKPEPLVAVSQAREFDRLLGRPIEPSDLSVAIDDRPVSVSEIPSGNPKIRIYEINGD